MSRILVTGGAGYIGSHIAKQLLLEGHTVVVLDNFLRGFREPLEILKGYGDLYVVEGDLTKTEDLKRLFQVHKIDLVMHLASLCSVDESVKNPELYLKNNAQGTLNLLEVMDAMGVKKIIFSSTCAVYGNAEYLPIDENHPTKPENPYGESKLRAEENIKQFGKLRNFNYVIFRYFNVCGADSEGEIGDSKKPSLLLVQNAVRGALGIEDFKLTCPTVDTRDGTPIRDYIDVLDVVRAHLRALEYLSEGGSNAILNIGSGKGWSVKEILDTVKEELKVNFEVKENNDLRQGEYKEVYGNIEKVKKVLGWQPLRTLKDSVQSLKKWYEKNPQGYKNSF